MSTLLLLTHRYPYGEGEQFIADELPYLAQRFSRVVVAPFTASGEARGVLDGVSVTTGLAETRAVGVAGGVWQGLGAPLCRRELLLRPKTLAQPRGLLRLFGTYRDAQRVARWVQAYVAQQEAASTIVYAYWLDHLALGAVLARAGIAAVARAHGWELYEEAHRPPFLPFRAVTLAHLDAVFPISAYAAAYLTTRYALPAPRCRLARLGVTDAGGQAVSSGDGILRIASCSALQGYKRVDLLICGIAALSSGQVVEWHHLGDGPEMAALRARARQLLPASVHWHFHGNLPHAAVRAFYQQHPVDVFVHVSAVEGIPVAIMEAMSAGIPVVAAGVGGVPEIIGDDAGILLPADPAPAEIAAAIAHVAACGMPLRQASHARWAAQYRAEVNYPAFAEQLASLACSHGTR